MICLKVLRVSVDFISLERLFHTCGPKDLRLLEPKVKGAGGTGAAGAAAPVALVVRAQHGGS